MDKIELISVKFSGSAQQYIRITKPGLTVEALVKGINEGKYFTTLSFCDAMSSTIVEVSEDGELVDVATIVSQLMDADTELFDAEVEAELPPDTF